MAANDPRVAQGHAGDGAPDEADASAHAELREEIAASESRLREQLDALKERISAVERETEAWLEAVAIPGESEAEWLPGDGSSPWVDGQLDLNRAGAEDLRRLGLSGTQARRVLARRERIGGFNSLDDLDEVPGIPGAQRGYLKSVAQVGGSDAGFNPDA